MLICFNAKKDYSDLPNFSLSHVVSKVENKGEFALVTFKKPLNKAFKVGTAVRLNATSGGYMYCSAAHKTATNKWKNFSADINGIVTKGSPNNKFWAGTCYVKPIIILNYAKTENPKTYFTKVQFEEINNKK